MKKIKKGLNALGSLIRQPSLLNHVISNEDHWKGYIQKRYPLFSRGLPVVHHDSLFDDFNVVIDPYAFLDGGSLPTDLALLVKFAQTMPGCRYFEIGTWRGESVANVARHATQCHTLNLSAREMKKLGMPEKYVNLHFQFSKSLENVVHLEGNSLNYDFAGLDRKFDLVFIDGDHHYETVKNDTVKVFEHLVHENSVVVWHDYAFNPEKVRYEVLAGILDGLPSEIHPNLYHFSNSLSAFHTTRKVGASLPDPPYEPRTVFTLSIKTH